MSIYSIIAFNAATQQLKQNQMDQQNLEQAKQKTAMGAESLDIERQTKEAQIKIANNQGALSDYSTKLMMDQLKKTYEPQEDLIDAHQRAQDLVDHQLQAKNQQAQQIAQGAAQDPDVQNHIASIFKATQQPNAPVGQPTTQETTGSPIASDPTQVKQGAINPNIPSIFPQNTAPQAKANIGGGLNLSGITPPPTMAGQGKGLDAQVNAQGVQQPTASPADQNKSGSPVSSQAGSPQATLAQTGSGAEPQASVAEETPPQDLNQVLQGLDNTPFGKKQSDYYMPNPNPMEAMKTGAWQVQKPPEIINSENPLRLNEKQRFVEENAKTLLKEGYTQDQVLGQLPSDLAETVNGIGRYQQSEQVLLGGMQATPQTRAAYIGLVRKVFPQYDVNRFSQVQEFRKEMANDSGNNLGARIVSANTIGSHLFQLSDLADSLKNQNIPVSNAVVNFVRTQLGHPEVTNFKDAKEIVSNEIENILSQKGATQSGVTRMQGNFNENMSPDQLKGFVMTNMPLIADRIQALRNQYKSNIGATDNGEILYPDTRQRFQQLYGSDVFQQMDKGNYPFSKSSSGAGGSNQLKSFKSEQEAASAGLKDGDRVTINGQTGTWRS